jgi:hypothetical protein
MNKIAGKNTAKNIAKNRRGEYVVNNLCKMPSHTSK